MATLNLGRIKPVFRGAYSGSTAYVVDDIVTHGDESFICIQAHGAGTQATSVTAYWTKLAAKGTDGTDVGTTITTQGDILFRDGSGLQRLAKGTAAQTLKMNSGATAPEWATVTTPTADFVKIASTDITAVSSISYQDIFDTTYDVYKIYISNYGTDTTQAELKYRWLTSGSTEYTGSTHWHFSDGAYIYLTDNSTTHAKDIARDKDFGNLSWWGGYTAQETYSGLNQVELTLLDPAKNHRSASMWGGNTLIHHSYCYEGASSNRYFVLGTGTQFAKSSDARTGIKFYWSTGSFRASGNISIYGMKA